MTVKITIKRPDGTLEIISKELRSWGPKVPQQMYDATFAAGRGEITDVIEVSDRRYLEHYVLKDGKMVDITMESYNPHEGKTPEQIEALEKSEALESEARRLIAEGRRAEDGGLEAQGRLMLREASQLEAIYYAEENAEHAAQIASDAEYHFKYFD